MDKILFIHDDDDGGANTPIARLIEDHHALLHLQLILANSKVAPLSRWGHFILRKRVYCMAYVIIAGQKSTKQQLGPLKRSWPLNLTTTGGIPKCS